MPPPAQEASEPQDLARALDQLRPGGKILVLQADGGGLAEALSALGRDVQLWAASGEAETAAVSLAIVETGGEDGFHGLGATAVFRALLRRLSDDGLLAVTEPGDRVRLADRLAGGFTPLPAPHPSIALFQPLSRNALALKVETASSEMSRLRSALESQRRQLDALSRHVSEQRATAQLHGGEIGGLQAAAVALSLSADTMAANPFVRVGEMVRAAVYRAMGRKALPPKGGEAARRHMMRAEEDDREVRISSLTGGGYFPLERAALRRHMRGLLRADQAHLIEDYVTGLAQGRPDYARAALWSYAAQAAAGLNRHDLQEDYLRRAAAIAPSVSTELAIPRFLSARGRLEEAREAVAALAARPEYRDEHAVRNLVNLIDRRFLWDRADSELARLSAPVAPVSPEAQRRSIYFLHNSLPFTSAGYATRTHGICLGVAKRDFDIRPVTRPGFPLDLGLEVTAADVPQASEIDGITYRRLVDFQRPDFSEPEYITRTADVFERILREHRPGLVHAASNYVTGLPALIAARRAALPYVYEARGFWEITRASREPNFRNSGQFRGMANLEALCAREADAVITLTTAMKDVLIERGVAEEKITLVHNSVDAARFVPRPRDEVLAARLGVAPDEPVIGYIGSHVIYEGLDDLIEACARLREKDVAFRLLLVGDGKETPDLLRRAEARGLSDRLIAPGRVPHEEVESYYSLVDIAPFPRKPWEVCEVVSPLKPFEAMAMEKAVIVSDVRALAEIASDGETGLHFRKGSVDSLSDALERLLADPGLRRDLGKAARAWIETHRTWDIAGARVADVYAQVLEARTTAER